MIRVAIVGTGAMAKQHAVALKKHDDCVIALGLAAMNVGPHPVEWLVMRI